MIITSNRPYRHSLKVCFNLDLVISLFLVCSLRWKTERSCIHTWSSWLTTWTSEHSCIHTSSSWLTTWTSPFHPFSAVSSIRCQTKWCWGRMLSSRSLLQVKGCRLGWGDISTCLVDLCHRSKVWIGLTLAPVWYTSVTGQRVLIWLGEYWHLFRRPLSQVKACGLGWH